MCRVGTAQGPGYSKSFCNLRWGQYLIQYIKGPVLYMGKGPSILFSCRTLYILGSALHVDFARHQRTFFAREKIKAYYLKESNG